MIEKYYVYFSSVAKMSIDENVLHHIIVDGIVCYLYSKRIDSDQKILLFAESATLIELTNLMCNNETTRTRKYGHLITQYFSILRDEKIDKLI